MTPLENYSELNHQCIAIAAFYGLNPLDPNYRPDFRTFLTTLLNLGYMVACVYTIWHYPSAIAMQSAASFAYSFQGPVKIYTVYQYHDEIYFAHYYIINMYEQFQRSQSVLVGFKIQRFSNVIRKLFNMYKIIVISTLVTFMLVAFAMTVVTGTKYVILPAYIPLVNASELRGYIITIIVQIISMIYAASGQIGADGVFSLCVIHVWPMCDIFEECVENLNISLQENNVKLSAIQFRNVMLMHREFYMYLFLS